MTSHAPESKSQESKVTAQFGPRAAAYVSSAVHASGEDLAQIAAIAKARQPWRALDMGCGGGYVSFHVAPHVGELVAYDLSVDMLEAVMAEGAVRGLGNIVPQQGSVAKMPFTDGAFDFVASRYSAHHWHDVAVGLREARRVLKPGGGAVFTDAVSPGPALLDTHLQAIELLRDPSHVRDYSTAEWVDLLEAAGFSPGTPILRRVRLEFSSWVARMNTPDIHVRATRALQDALPRDVAAYFEMEEDGSFTIDAMTIEAQ